MNSKLQSLLEDGRSRKTNLKPAVEKKRRDRINQSIAELRRLLLNHTSDPRLKNPKIEKAEILDLAVKHLQKGTDGRNPRKYSTNGHVKTLAAVGRLHHSEPSATMEDAGFQECVAQLTSYMHKITPAQRTSLIEGLKHRAEGQQPHNTKPGCRLRVAETDATSVGAICTSERREESPKFVFPPHSHFQPHSCSTPSHDSLSPLQSPWLSPSFTSYATFPPFSSFASHFSPPPSLSPLSSNTSFFSFSPTTAHSGPPALHYPPLTTLTSPPHPAPRGRSSTPSSSTMWRPWF